MRREYRPTLAETCVWMWHLQATAVQNGGNEDADSAERPAGETAGRGLVAEEKSRRE